MFARSGFHHQTAKKAQGSIPQIHETEAQAIQGGQPGEHYHLTEAEWEFLAAVVANQSISAKIYEPVMVEGELLLTLSGDCLVAWGLAYSDGEAAPVIPTPPVVAEGDFAFLTTGIPTPPGNSAGNFSFTS